MTETNFAQTVGLIGGGYWGKNLARNFHTLGALRTICDINESALDKFAKDYEGVKLTTNYQSMLNDPLITAVAIATCSHVHYDLAKQALLAGKDVYVEKPICLDVAECEELIKLAESSGRILMVGHILQYHPCVRHLQEMIGRGDLGKLYYVISNRLNLGSIRTEENALWSFAPHDISVILSLCGHQLPEQVRCTGADYLSHGVADVSMTTMRFAENVRAHIYVSWLNPFKEQKLVVVGSHGMVVFDDTKQWEDKLVLYHNHVTWSEGNIPQANKGDGKKVTVPQSEPLRNECEHFLNCCLKRVAPLTDGKEGLRVLRVLQAAQVSLNQDGTAKDPSVYHPQQLGALDYFAHPTAVVDHGANIGIGTKIWHFSHVMDHSVVGEGCNIGQNVVISSKVTLGRNVKVQNNVSIYSGVTCEDDVFLGPSMVFTNISNPRSAVPRKDKYALTMVRKGATVGANATIICGVELGHDCFVAAGAIVTRDVPPYALVVGNPAQQVGWMSRYGHRLDLPVSVSEGEEMTDTCPESGEEYVLKGDVLCERKTKSEERKTQVQEVVAGV